MSQSARSASCRVARARRAGGRDDAMNADEKYFARRFDELWDAKHERGDKDCSILTKGRLKDWCMWSYRLGMQRTLSAFVKECK